MASAKIIAVSQNFDTKKKHIKTYLCESPIDREHTLSLVVGLWNKFDTLNNYIKLYKYGCCVVKGNGKDVIRSYLRGKKHFVCKNTSEYLGDVS